MTVLKRIVTVQFHEKSYHLRPKPLCVSQIRYGSSRLACFAAMLSLLFNIIKIKLNYIKPK